MSRIMEIGITLPPERYSLTFFADARAVTSHNDDTPTIASIIEAKRSTETQQFTDTSSE
ncbi:hypothetical protein IFR05_017158, partial [Cadophora sp. M221]